jgi:hypothetical protein
MEMPGAGVVHGHVIGRHQASMQHARVLGNKSVELMGQQADHLPLGDVNADIVEQRRQQRDVARRAVASLAIRIWRSKQR